MKWVKALALVVLFVGGSLYAQTGMYWFSTSADDPTPVTCLTVEQGNVITLHAWLEADAPDWGWIGGFTFPIWFDEAYLDATAMDYDPVLDSYMFKGVRWPGDPIGENPGQAMWYAAVCLAGTPPCLPADGSNIHIGSITFTVLQTPPPYDCITVIDTLMYPPSNYASIGDETGTQTIYPDWEPFGITGPVGVAESNAPKSFFLSNVGPNPFRGVTSVSYGLPKKSSVNISVYDVSGRLVKTLVNGVKDAGTYTIEWDGTDNTGRNLSSGAYFLRMDTESFKAIKQLLILR